MEEVAPEPAVADLAEEVEAREDEGVQQNKGNKRWLFESNKEEAEDTECRIEICPLATASEAGAGDFFVGEVNRKIKVPEQMNKQIQMEELDEAGCGHSARASVWQLGKEEPDAYPRIERAGLDSLVLEKLLALAQEMDVVLPGTEEDDLSAFQMAALMGGPTMKGKVVGWTPLKAVFVPDDTGRDDFTAAASQWVPRGKAVSRSGPSLADRRDAGRAG
ncbi:unnamed protein product [Lampetra fluviatilis]